LILLKSRPATGDAAGAPGIILEAAGDKLVVAAGLGGVEILQIQAEGKRPMSPREFLAGHQLRRGDRFTAAS
jgi:methionyl-tRNA formyltransferase